MTTGTGNPAQAAAANLGWSHYLQAVRASRASHSCRYTKAGARRRCIKVQWIRTGGPSRAGAIFAQIGSAWHCATDAVFHARNAPTAFNAAFSARDADRVHIALARRDGRARSSPRNPGGTAPVPAGSAPRRRQRRRSRLRTHPATPRTIGRVGLEPLLHMISRFDRRTRDYGVIVNHTMGQHVAKRPTFAGDPERMARGGHKATGGHSRVASVTAVRRAEPDRAAD
jgi:hypothetical protein